MSWEDYKKQREEQSSWEQYKKQRENPVQISTNKSNNAPILQNIRNFAGDTGRTADNLGLGGKIGIKQSLNFALKAGETRNKTEQQLKNERVLGSKELTDTEKALYIAKQKGKVFEQNDLNNESNKNVMLPLLNNDSTTSQKVTDKYGMGNIDLTNRPVVKNEDGSISTVRSMSFQDDSGKEILVPTVVNGRIVSDEEAISHYYKTGEYLGKFNSIEEAEKYAEKLHEDQEKLYSDKSEIKNNANNDLPTYNLSAYNNSKVEEIANNDVLDRSIKKDQEKIQGNIENQTNQFSRKLAELAPSIGNMGVGTAISVANPVAGMAYFTTSAGGSYMQDALERGMTREQATTYGAIMGLMEGATEAVGIENFKKAGKGIKTLISGAGKTAVKEGTEQIAKNSIKTVLKDYGIGIADNVMQEAIIEPIQEITARAIAGQDKANWNDMGQRMLKAGIDGGLTSAIVGGANLGILSCVGVIEKTKNGQNVTQQELQTAVKDASTQLDVEKMITDSTQQQVSKYKTSTEQQQSTQNLSNTITQQITPTIQNNAQNGISEQTVGNKLISNERIRKDSENFAKQVDAVKNGTFPQKDMLTLGNTPQVLKDIGLPDLPITMTQRHLDTIMNESGKYRNANYHGLGEDIVKQLPEAINNPLDIVKSNTRDDSVVLTTYLADKNDNTVIASIKIDGTGKINNIEIDSNVLTSAYGRNNYEKFMEDNIKNGNLLYDIDRGVIKKVTNARFQLPRLSNSSTGARLQLPRTDASINNSVPQNTKNVNDTTINNYSMQESENNSGSFNLPQNNQNMQVLQEKTKAPISGDVKARKHYKSIMESQYTSNEAKAISKELMGTDTYVPDSNNSQLERANERILNSTPESELNSFMSKVMNGEKITATDIAVGEKLIQYYSKTGDKGKLQDVIQATAMAGTSAGQTVQALSLLNHQTPEGQAIWLQRSVDKMNNELARKKGGTVVKDENGNIKRDSNGNIKIIDKKGNDISKNVETFKFTQEMNSKIVDSKNNEELQNNLNDVYKELGQQVSKTNLQKIDAWRYFSMLANPKTHIRNIVGNTAMAGVQGVKNKVAGTIEGVVSKVNPNMERNHTIMSADKEVTTFAKNDIKNVADRLGLNENKYNPKTRLENSMRTFKSDALENTIGKLFDLNDNLLEAEDGWGLKAGYTKALSEYMTANNLNPDTITDKQLAKARNYAVEQAQEATFHQASAIASALNQFQNKNGLTKFIMDSTLPFKKTPINVAKAGLEYSPAGLAKSLIYDTVNLRKGNITVNKYIDNISKGLTGTGIALLGYALADAGILKASGSDDKDKEKYDEEMGKQTYSITIAGNTYSLDWLAPTGIPLFIGAECHEIMQTDKEEKTSSSDEDSRYNQAIKSATNILDSFTNAMNPMTEMSMLSGLTSALTSYDQGGSKMIATFGTNAVKSYVNQFVPTAVGQIARTTDEYERNTTSTKTGPLPKAIDTTKNQIMNKIPGLRQMLPIKTDIWGNQVKQSDNVIQRGLENSVFPWTRKEVSTSKVDNELTRLYDETGESAILPDTLSKKLTINGQDYRLTNEEYAKYKTSYGKTSYNLLNDLVSSSEYKNMSSSQKQTAIESIYDYAKEKNKVDYADKVKETIETSTNYNILEELKRSGGNQTQYLNYLSKTREIQGEKANQKKNQVLLDAKYSSKTKSIIYQNTTGKDDEVYQILKKLDSSKNIINQYLDYLQADLKADREDDGTEKGKAISGSKKKKVSNYINSIDSKDMSYVQRLYLAGINTTLSTSEKKKLFTYINENKSLTSKEKMEALDKLQGFTVYKNGKVTW